MLTFNLIMIAWLVLFLNRFKGLNENSVSVRITFKLTLFFLGNRKCWTESSFGGRAKATEHFQWGNQQVKGDWIEMNLFKCHSWCCPCDHFRKRQALVISTLTVKPCHSNSLSFTLTVTVKLKAMVVFLCF